MKRQAENIMITGAGSGLGRGLSLILAQKGYHILATDCKLSETEEVVSMISAANNSASAYYLDVTSESDILKVINETKEKQIDVLINNAGIQYVSKLEDFPQENWDQVVDVILKGTCLMTRAVLPEMRKNGFGRIINIGSIHSLIASPYKTAYVAAKHGQLGFSKVISLETSDIDITINTICPSYIRTPLVEAQIKNQAKVHNVSEEEVISKIMLQPMPKGTFITIEEIAATAEFLIGDMARNITGQTITIDGGWTIT